MTEYAINVDAEGETYGGEWAGAYNPYLYGLLDTYGFEGLKITDWGVYQMFGMWGAEELPEAERIALSWERGANLLGGYGPTDGARPETTQATLAEAYQLLVERNGQEAADEIISNAAYRFILVMMDLNMFDQPYSDTAYATEVVFSDSANEFGLQTQRKSVVMIKNDGTISADGVASEKHTVYVPYTYNTGFTVNAFMGINEGVPSWTPSMDLDILSNYFNVITDTVGEPSGEGGTYTSTDVIRASAEEIGEVDYILVGMTNAYSTSYYSNYRSGFTYLKDFLAGELVTKDEVWYPVSLQYGEYTAETASETSLGGVVLADGTKENRSYKGNTAPTAPNYGDLEALQYAAEVAGDIPVIVSMTMERGMVWSEAEPLADVILVTYDDQKNDVVAEIILGQTEPTGLLVFQQPASMEAVEAQVNDVPRDMECYVDAAGNTYDFAFGMNWSGVIEDERVTKYSAEPLTTIQNLDYAAYEAANH